MLTEHPHSSLCAKSRRRYSFGFLHRKVQTMMILWLFLRPSRASKSAIPPSHSISPPMKGENGARFSHSNIFAGRARVVTRAVTSLVGGTPAKLTGLGYSGVGIHSLIHHNESLQLTSRYHILEGLGTLPDRDIISRAL